MRRRLAVTLALACAPAIARGDDGVRAPAPAPAPAPVGKVTKLPRLLQAIAPEYPPAALAAKKTAKVKVRLHIDADGIVTSVDVLAPVGDGFDEAAVAAAMQYVFEPAEIDGAPAAIAVESAINFTLEDREIDAPPIPPTPPTTRPADQPPQHAGDMAQPISLEGVAMERGTRRRLAGVIVSIAELHLDAVTSEDGAFFFHGVPPGSYHVIAAGEGHDRFTREVELAKREAVEVRLWLRPAGGNLYETVVEGEREGLEVTKRTLQRQQLTSVPGTFGDPIRAIQTLPGIARAPFGLGLLLIRGSNPDDTGILVDGHEVPALFHFLGGPSIFNAEMLESIDLYPGGFPARFGRKHGGVVDLELRPTASDGVHGSAKADFIDAGGYARAPITKDLSIAFAGRRSYIDAFLGAVLPSPGPGASRLVTPIYYDLAARLDYDLHADGHASVFAIASGDSLRVLSKDPDAQVSTNLSSSISFFRLIGNYTRSFGGDLKLTISPSWGRDTITASGAQAEASGPFTSIGVVNDALSYRMRLHGRVDPRVMLDTGVDILSRVTTYSALLPIDNNYTVPQGADVSPTQLFRGAQTIGVGLHGDVGIDVTPRLKLIPGLRLDGYLLDGESRGSIDPRLVVRYRADDQWTLKGYVGRFSQPPQPEALDRRFGNPTVGLEHAEHYGLGYEWKPDRLWSIDSEIYYVHRRELVVFTQDIVQNPDGTFTWVNFKNTGVRDSYGFEAIVKREISPHLYGWLTYTFSRAHQQNDPAIDPVTHTTFDQPHVLNAVASYKPGGGWELGARLQFASGRPITPVVGSTYDADTGTYAPLYGDKRSQRAPNFVQLDVRAAHAWLFDRWSLEAYLDVINTTYAKNVEAYQYDYRYRQSSPITGFPILPTLGLKGTW